MEGRPGEAGLSAEGAESLASDRFGECLLAEGEEEPAEEAEAAPEGEEEPLAEEAEADGSGQTGTQLADESEPQGVEDVGAERPNERDAETPSREEPPSASRARRDRVAVHRARRRRRAGLIIGMSLAVAFIVVLLERDPSQPVAAPAVAEAEEVQELGRGGTRVLPNYEVVAYYGAPQAPELGVLGLTPPEEAVNVLNVRAREYADLIDRPVYPAFEFISTLAQNAPGPSGKYRFRQPDGLIDDYLKVASDNDFLLILDIQPGHSDFIGEVKRLEPYLRNPNVSIALDPEWNVPRDTVPGEVIGSVDAKVVNDVAKLMSEQIRELGLPQKLLIIHQFTDEMIRNPDKLRNFPGVALVLNSDGFGTPELKAGTYGRLAPNDPPPYPGFKLFFTEDTGLMTAQEVLDLRPRPKVVIYE